LTTILYGIKNCDTMRRARQWLDSHSVAYQFHDYQREGLVRDRLVHWCAQVGWEVLLNRAGTTFRKLDEAQRRELDEHKAVALMLQQPSMIKRPVLEYAGGLLVGFQVEIYATHERALRRVD
jgi:Spx/MgsR family transcriptional regulator